MRCDFGLADRPIAPAATVVDQPLAAAHTNFKPDSDGIHKNYKRCSWEDLMGRTTERQAGLTRLKITMVGLVAVAAILAGPTTASGSTVGVLTGALSYTAAPGEVNNVTVVQNGLFHRVSDSGTNITPGLGCLTILPTVVDCLGVASLGLDAGDGNDTVQVLVSTLSLVSGGAGS